MTTQTLDGIRGGATAGNASGSQTLVSKLADVMNEVESVPKRGRNDFHKYDYATEADIASAIRGGLARRGVMLLPSVTAWKDETRTTNSGERGEKSKTITTVDMVFSFVDGQSGQRLDLPWVGRGEDSSDKGIYKALTGAVKFFLMKSFLIPTGDDPEHEQKPQDRGARQQRQSSRRETTTPDGARVDAATGEQVSAKPKSSAGGFISAKQQAELIKAGHKAGWSASDFTSWLKAQGYGEWAKIPSADFSAALTVMESGSEPVGGIQ